MEDEPSLIGSSRSTGRIYITAVQGRDWLCQSGDAGKGSAPPPAPSGPAQSPAARKARSSDHPARPGLWPRAPAQAPRGATRFPEDRAHVPGTRSGGAERRGARRAHRGHWTGGAGAGLRPGRAGDMQQDSGQAAGQWLNLRPFASRAPPCPGVRRSSPGRGVGALRCSQPHGSGAHVGQAQALERDPACAPPAPLPARPWAQVSARTSRRLDAALSAATSAKVGAARAPELACYPGRRTGSRELLGAHGRAQSVDGVENSCIVGSSPGRAPALVQRTCVHLSHVMPSATWGLALSHLHSEKPKAFSNLISAPPVIRA